MKRCPVCRGESFSVPFPAFPRFLECADCKVIIDQTPDSLENPNEAYETGEHPPGVEALLEQEPRRGRYYDCLAERISQIISPPGPLLELGCGTGGLLRALENRGWEVEGIESAPILFQIAKDRISNETPVHCIRLGEEAGVLKRNPYAAVVAIDVLEHLPDPFLLPETAFRLLKPGGVLFIQTPNVESIRRRLQRDRWEQLAPGEHHLLHSRKSLETVLSRSGFVGIEIETISGTAVDGVWKNFFSERVGLILRLMDGGNAFRAVARKPES